MYLMPLIVYKYNPHLENLDDRLVKKEKLFTPLEVKKTNRMQGSYLYQSKVLPILTPCTYFVEDSCQMKATFFYLLLCQVLPSFSKNSASRQTKLKEQILPTLLRELIDPSEGQCGSSSSLYLILINRILLFIMSQVLFFCREKRCLNNSVQVYLKMKNRGLEAPIKRQPSLKLF